MDSKNAEFLESCEDKSNKTLRNGGLRNGGFTV